MIWLFIWHKIKEIAEKINKEYVQYKIIFLLLVLSLNSQNCWHEIPKMHSKKVKLYTLAETVRQQMKGGGQAR